MSHSREYLEAVLDVARRVLPSWAVEAIHREALPSAGGRAAHREPEEPAVLEKLAVAQMRPSVLRDVSDEELLQAHHRLHQLYGAAKKAGRAIEDYVNAHIFVEAEMRRRGMNIDPDDELSAEGDKLKKAAPLAELWELPDEVVVVPEFVSLIGSSVSSPDKAGDVDILLRAGWTLPDGLEAQHLLIQADNVQLPLRKVLDTEKSGRLHWVPSPQGPHSDYVALYDLVLRRRPVFAKQVVKAEAKPGVKPGRFVQPLKAVGTAAFMDLPQLVEEWAKKQFADGKRIAVEVKYDGERLQLHKAGEQIAGWTDDGNPFPLDKLPDLVREAKAAYSGDYILDGELLLFRGDKQVPRVEVVGLLHRKEPLPPDVKPRYWAFDVLWLGDEAQVDKPWSERHAALGQVKFGEFMRRAPSVLVENEAELKRAVERAANYPGSEGAMLKVADSPYALSGQTSNWAKIKSTKEIHVKVTAKYRTDAGTWVYEAETRDGVPVGRTYATELDVPVGTVLVVAPAEIKWDGEKLTWDNPRVRGTHPGPADTSEALKALAQFGRGPARKQEISEEGDTRGEAAAKFYEENWYRLWPQSGRGRFVLHAHWRGLTEDEASSASMEDLLKTNHSLHFDLRLEGREGLWGWTIFAGTTEENRGGLRIFETKRPMQVAPKLVQPREWLDVAKDKPYVAEPQGVGATSQKYAKIFRLDGGEYRVGVMRAHLVELFMNGEKLKGRYLIEFAPLGGSRKWIITKPEDQTPYAESRKPEDVVAELKQKGQRYLVWSDGKEKPRLITIEKAEHSIPIWFDKADEKRVVYGLALIPGVPDSQGDIVEPDEIEKAAHDFLVRSRKIGVQHERPAKAEVVESYVAPTDLEVAGRKVLKGSWVMAVHVLDDALWQAVKDGKLTGLSIGGTGIREEV